MWVLALVNISSRFLPGLNAFLKEDILKYSDKATNHSLRITWKVKIADLCTRNSSSPRIQIQLTWYYRRKDQMKAYKGQKNHNSAFSSYLQIYFLGIWHQNYIRKTVKTRNGDSSSITSWCAVPLQKATKNCVSWQLLGSVKAELLSCSSYHN